MPFPFEVSFAEVKKNLDIYVMEVFLNLQSEFMELPKGPGFIEYPVFEQGYEALKRATRDFGELVPDHVLATVYATPITFIVLRTMLGFTPPEWAYVTEQHTHTPVPQGPDERRRKSAGCRSPSTSSSAPTPSPIDGGRAARAPDPPRGKPTRS
jgi:hypothetical protein